MPTILKKDGFNLVLYSDDHEPIHVHVKKAGSEVKVDALTLEVMKVKGDISSKDVRRAVALVDENRNAIVSRWRKIHGKH